MASSTTAKRARAIEIALVITFATNYAITYAAKPVGSDLSGKINELTGRSGLGAGNTKPAPPISRSGLGAGNTKPAPPIS
jgi:hypothetical protein